MQGEFRPSVPDLLDGIYATIFKMNADISFCLKMGYFYDGTVFAGIEPAAVPGGQDRGGSGWQPEQALWQDKALAARYLYLMEVLGISTTNILCVTFTNKAAAEMKKRVHRQLPDQDLGQITTFHSFCVGLLKEDCHVVRYPSSFIALGQEDKEAYALHGV